MAGKAGKAPVSAKNMDSSIDTPVVEEPVFTPEAEVVQNVKETVSNEPTEIKVEIEVEESTPIPVVEENITQVDVVKIEESNSTKPSECGDCRIQYGSTSCKSCIVQKRLNKRSK